MSGSQHHDPVGENIETHPVKLAIGIAIGTVALIIGIILMVQLAVGSYGGRDMKGDPSMSPQAVAKRLAPVAEVMVDPNAPAPAPAAAPAATPVAARRRTTPLAARAMPPAPPTHPSSATRPPGRRA
jgi:hypothetical protein